MVRFHKTRSKAKYGRPAVTLPAKPKNPRKLHKKESLHCNNCRETPCYSRLPNFCVILNELRNHNQVCDGVVKCEDGKEFKIHRAILCAASRFFRTLFLNKINIGEPELKRVSIQVPSKYFSLLLDYAYTGSCALTTNNVQSLLQYADQLEVLGAVKLCSDFIFEHVTPTNCFDINKFAKWYFCNELRTKTECFIKCYFKEIVHENLDITRLPFEEIEEIWSDDELNVTSERIVFEAVKLWVEFCPKKRLRFLPEIVKKCIRFGLMSYCYYTDVVLKWEHFVNDKDCLSFLEKAKDLIGKSADYNTTDDMKYVLRPRIPYEVIFAVGGWSAGSPTTYMETYDPRADRWLLCSDTDQFPRAYHGMCSLQNLIYIIGGFNGNDCYYNTVRSFNPITRKWTEHACMYFQRCYVSITEYDGKIYALGGYNGRTRMNQAERYDPIKNQWELIAPMNRERSDASAATLQDKIYIAGGFNGNEVLRSAEVYDPVYNQWTVITQMLEPRSGVSILAHNDFILAMGGFNGHDRLRSVEKFTPTSNRWTTFKPMLYPRSNFTSTILENKVFVIGGFDGYTTIPNVECFDAQHDIWIDVAPMNLNRSALSAAVLFGLPNVREYSYLYKRIQNKDKPSNGGDAAN